MRVAALAAPFLVLTYASARSFLCNLRRFRHARAIAPLDGLDLTGAAVEPVRPPRLWPRPADITDPTVAAGYASLADGRLITLMLAGEGLVVAAGAACGALIPTLLRFDLHGLIGFVVVLALVIGSVVCKARMTRKWEPVARQYRRRYAELTAQPPPEPVIAPVTWRVRLLGRMGGQMRRTAQERRSGRPM